jgi:hypothetical protein
VPYCLQLIGVSIIEIKNGICLELGMVAHACNPSIWEAEAEESNFEAYLSL